MGFPTVEQGLPVPRAGEQMVQFRQADHLVQASKCRIRLEIDENLLDIAVRLARRILEYQEVVKPSTSMSFDIPSKRPLAIRYWSL